MQEEVKTESGSESRVYWATEEPKKLAGTLEARRKDFLQYLYESGILSRVYLNWQLWHNFLPGQFQGSHSAIEVAGEEGEQRLIRVNEFRSVTSLVASYVTAQLPAWDTLSKNPDAAALEETRLANQILDSYMDNQDLGAEEALKDCVKDGLLFSCGYLWNPWDDLVGEEGAELGADPDTGEIFNPGDFKFLNPKLHDVTYDFSAPSWKEKKWVHIRWRMNRWDLVELYGNADPYASEDGEAPLEGEDLELWMAERAQEKRDKILALPSKSGGRLPEDFAWILDWTPRSKLSEDYVDVDFFYHERTPAIPEGRLVIYAGDCTFEDGPLKEKHIPLHRWIPDKFTLTTFGWTPCYDVQGPQEGLNAIASTILTNINNLGPTKIWFKDGEPINLADLEPGINAIQSRTKPEVLNLLQTPNELFTGWQMYTQIIERLMQTSAVSRGASPPNVKSGSHAALLESRTQQGTSELIQNWHKLLSSLGTSILKTLQNRASETMPRLFAIVGVNKRHMLESFTSGQLQNVDRVTVVAGNPLFRTPEGRFKKAEIYVQANLVKTPEELETVLETGDTSRLMETATEQVNLIHFENDLIVSGKEPLPPGIHEDHILHIQKHATVASRPDVRKDPERVRILHAHIALHVDKLKDPATLWLMAALGYRQAPPLPGMAMGMGMAPGPGGPQEGLPPGVGGALAAAAAGGGEGAKPRLTGGTPDAAEKAAAAA